MGAAEIVDTPAQAAAQEPAPLLVREPLERFLDGAGLGSGAIEAERIGDGHSNVTYLVRRGGERFVLRRPPRPPLPPSAHDVLREAQLLTALTDTATRAPRVLAVCDDLSVLGVPFYVMEEVAGTVITDAVPPALDTPAERARIGEDLVDALVEIHAVDWQAAGLDGFGKPSGYLERQLRRFSGLWEHNKTRELPVVAEVGDWLAANMPPSPPATIVHGDYRLGNVMVADDPPARVVAVFDWELATIGDPLADLGYLTVTWIAPDDPDDTMFSSLTSVTRQPGFPTREQLVARYEQRSGRTVGKLHWHQALALWKAAVFMEGNYKRFLAGASDDSFMAVFDEGVPALAEKAREIALTGS
ncbi:MAG TPA: phosphotransferase family protein [Thermoleophilaceae bacterium]|nr:phosphotransferase family protein [Thermoleophilaceae bacterium]